MADIFKTDKNAKFELVTSAFGTGLSGTYKGEISAGVLKAFGFIPEEEHRKVFSALPDGTCLDDAYSYPWLLFTSTTGKMIVYGKPWIDINSIVVDSTSVRYTIEIVDTTDFPSIFKTMMTQVGRFEYSIKVS